MKIYIFLFISLIILSTSCKKEKQLCNDSLVLGTYYGNCAGNCFNVYRLDYDKLQEDEIPEHLIDYTTYTFSATKTLAESKFELVKNLIYEIPAELKLNTNKVYGCPDCADEGGVFLEVTLDGKSSRFNIDNYNSQDQSVEILSFKTKIHDAVHQINN